MSEGTRERLLQTGIDMLASLSPADLVAALRTREISRRTGVSAPTFFHHFASVEDYAAALVARIYAVDRTGSGAAVEAETDLVRGTALPVDALRFAHEQQLERMVADPEFRVRVGMWALGGQGADAAYKDYLDESDVQITRAAVALLAHWGREPRPPLDVAAVTAMTVALSQGGAIRHLLDPDLMTMDRYCSAMSGMVMVMLRLEGDHRVMADRLAEMNYYPAGARAASGSERTGDDLVARCLEAAAELFGSYGYEATSIAQLARQVGVHPSTVYELFDSKASLALGVLDRHAAVFLAARAELLEDTTAVHDWLTGVAAFVGPHPGLARLYLSDVGSADPHRSRGVLLTRTEEVVAAAQAAGVLRTDLGSAELAELLLELVIRRALRHPGAGPEAAARWAELVLGDSVAT